MTKILIIGAGGVGRVVAHKCAQLSEVFTEIMLASRTLSKCEQIAAEINDKMGRSITTAQVDADNVPELVTLLKQVKPTLVINVALPYQDLTIMDACLEAGGELFGHGQLRASRYSEIRIQLAMGLSRKV